MTVQERMTVRSQLGPILIENSLRMGVYSIDILMLSIYSSIAVAAVGLASNLAFFLSIMLTVVSVGTAVTLGQIVGAQRDQMAERVTESGLFLTLVFSVFMAVLFFAFAPSVVGLFSLEPLALDQAKSYVLIIGVFCIGLAISGTQSAILRAYGHGKAPMQIQALVSLLNILGNYLALFHPDYWFVEGVVGVAISTVLSQCLGALMSSYVVYRLKIPMSVRGILTPKKEAVKSILKMGLPSSAEILSYNMAQIVLSFVVASLGTTIFVVFTVIQSIARMMFVIPMSVGSCAQILTSFFVGRQQINYIVSLVNRLSILSIAVVTLIATVIWLSRSPISNFYMDSSIDGNTLAVMLIVFLLIEPARSVNLVVISALKGAGDVVFPVKLGLVSMWLISVFLGYAFSSVLGFGLLGIFIAQAFDETLRALIVWTRWIKMKWVGLSQTLVKA